MPSKTSIKTKKSQASNIGQASHSQPDLAEIPSVAPSANETNISVTPGRDFSEDLEVIIEPRNPDKFEIESETGHRWNSPDPSLSDIIVDKQTSSGGQGSLQSVQASSVESGQGSTESTPEPPPGISKSYKDDEGPRRESVHSKHNKTRVVMINYHQNQKYGSNYITTAKYSIWSFIPFFLYEQFRRYSNIFFLCIAFLQQIPDVSPTGRWTTLIPLLTILSISAVKEIIEDVKRHRADISTNNKEVLVLSNEEFRYLKWTEVHVGDFVKIENNHFFPADIVVFSTTDPLGVCYIETSNLDGETNLKIRQAQPQTANMKETRRFVKAKGFLECGVPNKQLYEFAGSLKLESENKVVALGPDQLLLRGAKLRNTKWIIGQVIYTGFDTKLMKNSTKVPLKRSTLDKQTNHQIIMLFIFLIIISFMSAAFSQFFVNQGEIEKYAGSPGEPGKTTTGGKKDDPGLVWILVYDFLTFVILFNNLIPISLTVTLELVRFVQALFINWDQDMYHLESDTPAMARTSNLNEELGQIRYIFSDKTGTLTKNSMVFKGCSVGGVNYSPEKLFPPNDNKNETDEGPLIQDLLKTSSSSETIREFLTLLALCHNVIPERKIYSDGSEDIIYHAASPDEKALVMGAREFGFTFLNRTPNYVDISLRDKIQRFEILCLIQFTSTRKRMTVIARCPDGNIRIYCKGADSVIYERLSPPGGKGQELKEVVDTTILYTKTLSHLEDFATIGLRTLCCATKLISEDEFNAWNATFQEAANSINDREAAVDAAAELIETNLTLLGATAIEDKLQDFVPETIAAFLEAGIRVWVLTGDKQETAINIGYSCKLLTPSTTLLMVNQETERHTSECIQAYANELSISLNSFRTKKALGNIVTQNAAVIIDGKSLTYALTDQMRRDFVALCCNCKAVIVCRASPLQKADIVESVTQLTGAVTLAIGDGANDVAMIQKAHVGVGISGNEGLQAVSASDYAIAQFYFLKKLLFVHGAWNHSRITKTIFFSFYKNICLYIIELWFAIYNAWSGQVIFERWTIGAYNVLFTSLQPIVIGIFDQNRSMKQRLENPSLYHQTSGEFTLSRFFSWVLNSLVHSICLFWLTGLFIGEGVLWSHGMEGSFLVLGNAIYTYVVIVVSLKAGLVTSAWTKWTHVSIWGSVLFWLIFLIGYSFMWHFTPVGAEISGIAEQLFTAPVFWIGLFVIPTATLMPDFVYKAIQGTCCTTGLEFNQENVMARKSRSYEILRNYITTSDTEPSEQGETDRRENDGQNGGDLKTDSDPEDSEDTRTSASVDTFGKDHVTENFFSIFNRSSSTSIIPLTQATLDTKEDPAKINKKSPSKNSQSLSTRSTSRPSNVPQDDEESPKVLNYSAVTKTISRKSLISKSGPVPFLKNDATTDHSTKLSENPDSFEVDENDHPDDTNPIDIDDAADKGNAEEKEQQSTGDAPATSGFFSICGPSDLC